MSLLPSLHNASAHGRPATGERACPCIPFTTRVQGQHCSPALDARLVEIASVRPHLGRMFKGRSASPLAWPSWPRRGPSALLCSHVLTHPSFRPLHSYARQRAALQPCTQATRKVKKSQCSSTHPQTNHAGVPERDRAGVDRADPAGHAIAGPSRCAVPAPPCW